LSLGWQLQRLSSAGKWDVKNVKKWQAVTPVSGPIGGVFAVMKTLRDVDERHSPAAFAEEWKDRIYAVIDISHDRPVYDPTVLEEHGVQYHKLPTVSKIPPTKDEVRDFISLVDRLREEMAHRKETDQAANAATLLAVHCHYGFNRSGFFVVSYLVSRLGYTVQEGLDEFEKHRPPGIRHEHFIDTLFVRYSGLK
jgi:protein-tyrosine phosphatase